MMAGILLALWAGGPLASPARLACLCGLFGVSLPMALRPPSAFPQSLRLPALAICCLLARMIASGWQLMRLPDAIPGDGTRADVSGMIRKVDGRLDGRLRIWLEVDRVHRGNSMI